MKRLFLLISLALLLVSALVFAACGQGAPAPAPAPPATNGGGAGQAAPAPVDPGGAAAGDPIVIHYPTFQTGVNTAAAVVQRLIDDFNEYFSGTFYINKEAVPGDQNYFEMMLVRLAANDLPPVVYGGGNNLLDLILAQDLAVDLTDAVHADPEWLARFDEGAMAVNSRNGRIFASSNERSMIGYWYNRELFAEAGLSGPATTWDEFFDQLVALNNAGITPMSLDTGDNAWVTMLWLGSMVGTHSADGLAFMNYVNPMSYNVPAMIHGISNMQYILQNHTTLDAIGGRYEHAANNFFASRTAMIANGPWMIGDFFDLTKTYEGFADKIGAAAFPGGFVYDSIIEGFIVTRQNDPELEAAAIEMVRFFTSDRAQQIALEMQGMLPASPNVEITESVKESFPHIADFLSQTMPAPLRGTHFSATMFPNVIDVLPQELPSLYYNQITPEEFATALSEAAVLNR